MTYTALGGVSLTVTLSVLGIAHGTLMDHQMGYDDIQSYSYHTCTRPCENDEPSKVCEYDFLIEHYHTMSRACYNCPFTNEDCARPHCVAADGVERGIMTVNRMMPGPAIHVCENDTIRVRVHNKLEMAEGVTIHWHGVLQHGSPHMDGVGMVTQCAIPAFTSFTYTFVASTPGTSFWHAHSGIQRADGVFGHLVVRQKPMREYHIGRYDLDMPRHAVLVNDWEGRSIVPSFTHHHHSDGSSNPTSILINGKGKLQVYQDPLTGKNATTPREEFIVQQGNRYRFRVVSNGINICPIRISIDDHMMTIIATDGYPVEPMEVESFTIFAGERYDFVLNANQNISTYMFRAEGLADCDVKYHDASQTALLRYEGAVVNGELDVSMPELHGKELNPFNTKQTATKIQVSELKSVHKDDPAVTRPLDKQFTVRISFKLVNNPRFHNELLYSIQQMKKRRASPQLNSISMMLPPAPALSQIGDIPQDLFCNANTMTNKSCADEFCECIHLLRVDLGDVVEMVLVDEDVPSGANHPMHMHGHGFRVLAMDKLAAFTKAAIVEAMDAAGNISRNLDRPPIKDTVAIPEGGYTIIRFHANNPGMWFFHCHIEYHAETGMGLLLQVGDVSQFPRLPYRFPKCGSWDGYDSQGNRLEEPDDGKGDGDQVGDGDSNKCTRTVPVVFLLFSCNVIFCISQLM